MEAGVWPTERLNLRRLAAIRAVSAAGGRGHIWSKPAAVLERNLDTHQPRISGNSGSSADRLARSFPHADA